MSEYRRDIVNKDDPKKQAFDMSYFLPSNMVPNCPIVFLIGLKHTEVTEDTLAANYMRSAFAERYIFASFDSPFHGEHDGDKGSLDAWVSLTYSQGPHRIIEIITERIGDVISFLGNKPSGRSDYPVALIGVSRGGFIALHAVASAGSLPAPYRSCLRCAALMTPMIELRGMREYEYAPQEGIKDAYQRTLRTPINGRGLTDYNGASLLNRVADFNELPASTVPLFFHTNRNDTRVLSHKANQLALEIARQRGGPSITPPLPALGQSLGEVYNNVALTVHNFSVPSDPDNHTLPLDAYAQAVKQIQDIFDKHA